MYLKSIFKKSPWDSPKYYTTKEDLSIPKEFIYYRIAEVLSECIKFIVQYKRKLSLAECINPHQIKIILR